MEKKKRNLCRLSLLFPQLYNFVQSQIKFDLFKISIHEEECWMGIELILFHLNWKMSVLSQKLQEASKLFQSHAFSKSLAAYQECIDFCRKTDEAQSVIFNILSTKATLEYIQGNYDASLVTLNSVLKKEPHHFLSLLRRSQVYKKQNKLKKAQKDLDTIFVYCPDNLQISAFKVQIQHLLLKQSKQHQDITSESDQQEESEEEELNFSRLKLIDRKSIDKSLMKQRKSRVTILGDTTFQYKQNQEENYTRDSEDFEDKALRTYRQIEFDDEQEDSVPLIRIQAPKRNNKSILKNKGTSIFIQNQDTEARKSKYLGRQSKLLHLIKNIDGKVILSAEHQHSSNPQIKQVEFRKSISSLQCNTKDNFLENTSTLSMKDKRKSCLKRPSFEIPDFTTQKVRKSKFEMIDQTKIDGHVIAHKKRKSIQGSPANGNDEVRQDTDSDDSSEHNIFGSKRFVLSQDMKNQLGIGSGEDIEGSGDEVTRSFKGKKSILKKSSSILVLRKSTTQHEHSQPALSRLHSKKSVMFNCTL